MLPCSRLPGPARHWMGGEAEAKEPALQSCRVWVSPAAPCVLGCQPEQLVQWTRGRGLLVPSVALGCSGRPRPNPSAECSPPSPPLGG